MIVQPQTRAPALNAWDAVVVFVLAVGGTLALAAVARPLTPAWAINYVTHAWQLALPLFWFVVLRKHFPIGPFSRRALRGWFGVWWVFGGVVALLTLVGRHDTSRQRASALPAARSLLFASGAASLRSC